jgi:putative phage abortive infection protein
VLVCARVISNLESEFPGQRIPSPRVGLVRVRAIRSRHKVKNCGRGQTFLQNLFRAQLSSYELALLFYNCLSTLGESKFKPMVEEFAFLENLDKSILLSQDDATFFAASAFNQMLLGTNKS